MKKSIVDYKEQKFLNTYLIVDRILGKEDIDLVFHDFKEDYERYFGYSA